MAYKRDQESSRHREPQGSLDSYHEQRRRVRELESWCLKRNYDLLVSINSNDCNFSYEHGRESLKHVGAVIDRFVLGSNWARHDPSERTFFIAVPEQAGLELHYHLLLKLPVKLSGNEPEKAVLIKYLGSIIPGKRMFPHGDIHIRDLSLSNSIAGSDPKITAVRYLMKQLWKKDNWDNMILSSEFHRERTRIHRYTRSRAFLLKPGL